MTFDNRTYDLVMNDSSKRDELTKALKLLRNST
jgi:hypothetical protein